MKKNKAREIALLSLMMGKLNDFDYPDEEKEKRESERIQEMIKELREKKRNIL